MPDWLGILQAQKSASTVLVFFVRSVDRYGEAIDQEYWVTETLTTFGLLFGGATLGVWVEGKQDAVGFVIDRDYLESRFPLEEE